MRLQQDEDCRKGKQARDDSITGALLRHEVYMEAKRRQDRQSREAALSEEVYYRDAESVARLNERHSLMGLKDDFRYQESVYRDDSSARALQSYKATLETQKA